jgi:hypothetical protein
LEGTTDNTGAEESAQIPQALGGIGAFGAHIASAIPGVLTSNDKSIQHLAVLNNAALKEEPWPI